jgi:RHS repeat-associated protein
MAATVPAMSRNIDSWMRRWVQLILLLRAAWAFGYAPEPKAFTLGWTNPGRVAWEFAAPLPHAYTPGTRRMTYNDDNQLATFQGPTMGSAQNVTLDLDGNMTWGPGTNDTFTAYSFNARNWLLGMGNCQYGYDSGGYRTSVTNGASVTRFVVNPSTGQALMRIRPGVTNYYIWGEGLLYEVTETATRTNMLTYHPDLRGSTVALTDANGVPTDRIEYSLYGFTTYRAGTNDTPFLYNGRYGVMTDPNGLLYMQARYYNPYLCRFINADPSGFAGGLNFYAAFNGNPVSLADPFGLGAVQAATGGSWVHQALAGTALGDWANGFSSGLQSWVNGEDLSRYTPAGSDAYQSGVSSGYGAVPSAVGLAALALTLPTGGAAVEAEALTGTEAALAAKGTETFYRTMSQANYDALAATGKLPATSETFISPSLEYAQQYNGVTVQFNVQAGTTDSLLGMGVRNAGLNGGAYGNLPLVQSGWGSSSAFFKLEGNVVNVGLGRGSALNTFNNNIVNFNLVPKP